LIRAGTAGKFPLVRALEMAEHFFAEDLPCYPHNRRQSMGFLRAAHKSLFLIQPYGN
jgi:hypothetical protein